MNQDYLKGRKDVKDLKEGTEHAYEKATNYAQGVLDKGKEYAGAAKDKVTETASNVWDKTKEKAVEGKDYLKGVADETIKK